MTSIPKHLSQLSPTVNADYPLASHTYIKVGGNADFFVIANNSKQLISAVKAAQADNLPHLVLGAGSNILITSAGFRGLVIINRSDSITIDPKTHQATAASGVIVNQLVNQTINHNLQGLEEFLGIPGTVGGAVYNNSHHLEHLIGDYIDSVDALDNSGNLVTFSNIDCQFAYDYSIFQKNNFTIISALFQLNPGDKVELTTKAQAALKRRRDTQPLELPSSGCMFKNIGQVNAQKFNTPEGQTAAGYLIDKAGLKGHKVGGASVSTKHANFIINEGTATPDDIIQLSTHIIDQIKSKYGVTLEREVFIIDPQGK